MPFFYAYEYVSERNDQRLRRVFLCFYSAIFKLMSAKFSVWSTVAPWNFDSSFGLMSCMFVPNFEAIILVTLVLESENRRTSFA